MGDYFDYNEPFAHYASTVVIDKEDCKDKLMGHNELKTNVDLYLICTLGPGLLDENGNIIDHSGFFGDDIESICNITKPKMERQGSRKVI